MRGLTAGALAVSVMVSAPAFAQATDDPDDDAGKLGLNTAVLVDESVGSGATGDFAVRAALFSTDLSARVRTQQELSAERLAAVDTVSFSGASGSSNDYRPVRATLFRDYASVVLPGANDEAEEGPVFSGVAAVVVVPLVIVVGVFLGRFWVRRKRGAL